MIGKVIYDVLTEDSTVSTLVSTRVYPSYADTKATYPLVTYDVVSNVATVAKGTVSLVDVYRVQVNCIATTYAGAIALAVAVRSALEGFSGLAEAGYYMVVTTLYDGEVDLVHDEDVYGRAIDFRMKVKKITG